MNRGHVHLGSPREVGGVHSQDVSMEMEIFALTENSGGDMADVTCLL